MPSQQGRAPQPSQPLCPNITGGFGAADGDGTWSNEGAFWVRRNNLGGVATGGYTISDYGFDASRVSSLYGRSSNVQPASIRAMVVIKI